MYTYKISNNEGTMVGKNLSTHSVFLCIITLSNSSNIKTTATLLFNQIQSWKFYNTVK